MLAAAAPTSADTARAFLAAASSPLANAAWRYDAAFGWTDVTPELMQDYVSAQTYALRAAGTGRFGYAWSPTNSSTADSDALAVRLAAAIADSGDAPEAACGASWCKGELAGASITTAWRTFGAWKPSRLAFVSPEQTLAPGAVSAPLTVELQTSAGTAYTTGAPVTVELTSSSPTAELAAGPGGEWTPTLAVPIASGASTTSLLRPRRDGPHGHDHRKRNGQERGDPGCHRRYGRALSTTRPERRRRAGARSRNHSR